MTELQLPTVLALGSVCPSERVLSIRGEYDPVRQRWTIPIEASKTTWCQTSSTGYGKGSDPDSERDDET